MYSGPSILQPFLLRPPLIIGQYNFIPKCNFCVLLKFILRLPDLKHKTTYTWSNGWSYDRQVIVCNPWHTVQTSFELTLNHYHVHYICQLYMVHFMQYTCCYMLQVEFIMDSLSTKEYLKTLLNVSGESKEENVARRLVNPTVLSKKYPYTMKRYK